MLNLAGSHADELAHKFVERESLHQFSLVRKVHFEPNIPHGITFEDDGKTVRRVAPNSQAAELKVAKGWTAFKLETNGVVLINGFEKILNAPSDVRQACTILFGVPNAWQSDLLSSSLYFLEEKEEPNCVHVHVRFLVSRLYNCNIPQETFEADIFAEFMWLAPWDLPAWKHYMNSLDKYEGYEDLLKVLDVEDWATPDEKQFVKPSKRQQEVYYSERVVRSFDRQLDLEFAMGTPGFKPTWKPRIIFSNLRSKCYDEMNFGDSSYSMVNIGNQWYTVWRRNINQAVFFETFELKNFPYDIQELTINVLCTHPKTRVKLRNHKCYRSSCVVLKDNIMLPEWEYLGMRCSVGDDKSGRFSLFTFEAEVRRIPNYFIKSGQFIFTSITLVSFLVFGIPAEHDFIGERLSYGSTMLLTTVAFKWLISEKMPNLPYDTYLDDYSQWGFYIQICIMLSNGAMLFVRFHEDGEMNKEVLQCYDYICFGIIFTVWGIYQIYAYFIRVPRIVQQESERLRGMTKSMYERVGSRTLAKITVSSTYKKNNKLKFSPRKKVSFFSRQRPSVEDPDTDLNFFDREDSAIHQVE